MIYHLPLECRTSPGRYDDVEKITFCERILSQNQLLEYSRSKLWQATFPFIDGIWINLATSRQQPDIFTIAFIPSGIGELNPRSLRHLLQY
jgi:hypothetical protein